MTATVQKWGNSLALRLPKAVAQQVELSEGDSVELQVNKNTLVVRPARRQYRLADLMKKITKHNRHDETEWGPPVGKEIW